MVTDGESREIRCRQCRALLALLEGNDVVIERGGMQARFDGRSGGSIVCYRCKRLNVIRTS